MVKQEIDFSAWRSSCFLTARLPALKKKRCSSDSLGGSLLAPWR